MCRAYQQREDNMQLQKTRGVWEDEVMRKLWVRMSAGGIERKEKMKPVLWKVDLGYGEMGETNQVASWFLILGTGKLNNGGITDGTGRH